jgi:hypothetical protein
MYFGLLPVQKEGKRVLDVERMKVNPARCGIRERKLRIESSIGTIHTVFAE